MRMKYQSADLLQLLLRQKTGSSCESNFKRRLFLLEIKTSFSSELRLTRCTLGLRFKRQSINFTNSNRSSISKHKSNLCSLVKVLMATKFQSLLIQIPILMPRSSFLTFQVNRVEPFPIRLRIVSC